MYWFGCLQWEYLGRQNQLAFTALVNLKSYPRSLQHSRVVRVHLDLDNIWQSRMVLYECSLCKANKQVPLEHDTTKYMHI